MHNGMAQGGEAEQPEPESPADRKRRLVREATARYRARKRGETVPLMLSTEPPPPACEHCGGEVPPKMGNGGGHPKRFCSSKCKAASNNTRPEKRWSYVLATYGLTKAAHDDLLAGQDFKCAVCRSTDPKSPNWHVDHCHVTGRVRGLLCLTCNSGIGMLADNPDLLRSAAVYLEQHQAEEGG